MAISALVVRLIYHDNQQRFDLPVGLRLSAVELADLGGRQRLRPRVGAAGVDERPANLLALAQRTRNGPSDIA